MKRKNRLVPLILALVWFFSTAAGDDGRIFLRSQEGYSEIDKLKIQLSCLRVELQERERLKEFQFHQLAQSINQALSNSTPQSRTFVELSNLDVFNYSMAGITLEEVNQKIAISILVNQKFVDQKSEVEKKRFYSECFRLASQKLAKVFVDYDEYRDLVVRFYPLEFAEQPLAVYQEGGYSWGSGR
ncbi:MAG: hypothetical protein A2Z27_01575 [candidate division Zixibacteria bacterium RBG_16_50_21]|nr:MAG: hypothetical protein A2Z27_01575 [candidate division Zixibacteria bacterium RBG_16_50_21]